MPESDSGKSIINKLRKTLKRRVDKVIGHALRPEIQREKFVGAFSDEPEMIFAKNLVKVNGKFSYCSDKKELIANLSRFFQENEWNSVFCEEENIGSFLDMAGIPFVGDPNRLDIIELAVTGCEFLIARTGSVVVSSAQVKTRRVFAHAPIHVVIAYTSQLKNEIGEALTGVLERYGKMPSMITSITGPSRTADIEKTLVMGMHGPQELYVFLVKDN
jgi:L-lactate dehydrogenase complex protein LldG